MGSQSGLQGTRPAAAAVLGISPAAELSLLGAQMHTSNHSVCHPCSNRVSATSRTAVYGPVRTVVWEGRSCEAPPIPIFDPEPNSRPSGRSLDGLRAQSHDAVSAFTGRVNWNVAPWGRLAVAH